MIGLNAARMLRKKDNIQQVLGVCGKEYFSGKSQGGYLLMMLYPNRCGYHGGRTECSKDAKEKRIISNKCWGRGCGGGGRNKIFP